MAAYDPYDDVAGPRSTSTTERELRSRARQAWRYLSTRRAECWGFFIAGVVFALIFG
ncbi:MAG: hypothetical protein ACFB2Z_06250 [Maricaulaceae bacterium]